jgi:hypothetical protein
MSRFSRAIKLMGSNLVSGVYYAYNNMVCPVLPCGGWPRKFKSHFGHSLRVGGIHT